MIYAIRFVVPGLTPIDAQGSTLFDCLGSFFAKLNQAAEGFDACLEVQMGLTKTIAELVPQVHTIEGPAVGHPNFDGSTITLSRHLRTQAGCAHEELNSQGRCKGCGKVFATIAPGTIVRD